MQGAKEKGWRRVRAVLGRVAAAVALVTLKYWAFAPGLVEEALRKLR